MKTIYCKHEPFLFLLCEICGAGGDCKGAPRREDIQRKRREDMKKRKEQRIASRKYWQNERKAVLEASRLKEIRGPTKEKWNFLIQPDAINNNKKQNDENNKKQNDKNNKKQFCFTDDNYVYSQTYYGSAPCSSCRTKKRTKSYFIGDKSQESITECKKCKKLQSITDSKWINEEMNQTQIWKKSNNGKRKTMEKAKQWTKANNNRKRKTTAIYDSDSDDDLFEQPKCKRQRTAIYDSD